MSAADYLVDVPPGWTSGEPPFYWLRCAKCGPAAPVRADAADALDAVRIAQERGAALHEIAADLRELRGIVARDASVDRDSLVMRLGDIAEDCEGALDTEPRTESSQPVAERVAATETGGTEAPCETVVASSSCGACSAMRERAEAAERAVSRLRSRLARTLRYALNHRSGAWGEIREWRQLPVGLRKKGGPLLTRHGRVWSGRTVSTGVLR